MNRVKWLKYLRKGSKVIVRNEWAIERLVPSIVERVFIGKHVQRIHVKGFGSFDRKFGTKGFKHLEPHSIS